MHLPLELTSQAYTRRIGLPFKSYVTPPKQHKMQHACIERCPGNYECVCDKRILHELHICSAEGCYCHSQARYDKAI